MNADSPSGSCMEHLSCRDCTSSTDDSSESAVDVKVAASRDYSPWLQDAYLSDGEKMLAKDMENMSLQERERVYDDIHGVSGEPDVPYDPAVIQAALDAVYEKIGKIRGKSAYSLAMFLCPRYVQDPRLPTMYLYSLGFDTDLIAYSIVDFYKIKLQLFGMSKLGKSIQYSDLPTGAQKVYMTGAHQFFPRHVKDRSGRPLCFLYPSIYGTVDTQSGLQAFFYTLIAGAYEMTHMALARRAVLVAAYIGAKEHPANMWEGTKGAIQIAKCVPLRYAACHFCTDQMVGAKAVSLIQLSLKATARVRVRTLYGSMIEVMYQLATYGISKSVLPVNEAGVVDLESFKRFEQDRMDSEKRTPQFDDLVPTELDVLIGRGRSFQNHPGNIRFLRLVDSLRPEHAASSKAMKAKLSERARITTLNSGGRFLRQKEDGPGWKAATEAEAKLKVRHAFRAKPSSLDGIHDRSSAEAS